MSEKISRNDRSFIHLNAVQFLGALNDNIFKLLIIFSLIALYGNESAGKVTAVVGIIFVLPFLMFTPIAGVICDRLSKRTVIIWVKLWECLIMLTGVIGFYLKIPLLQYTVLFMMSMQSAFFGPAKFGIIPELVDDNKLSKANSYVVSFTMLAIILGSFFGPFLTHTLGGSYSLAAMFCVIIAIAGSISAFMIHNVPAAHTESVTPLHRFDTIFRLLYAYSHHRKLMFSIIASMYFYFTGAFMQLNIIPYGMEILGWTQEMSGYLFLVAAIGIAMGATIAGKCSKDHIEFGLVPLGAIGLAGSITVLSFTHCVWGIVVMLFVTGVSSGLFLVPIQTYIQHKSPQEHRGKLIAASGFIGWVGILFASLLLYVLRGTLNLSAAGAFLPLGLLTCLLGIVTAMLLPQFLTDTKELIIRTCGRST